MCSVRESYETPPGGGRPERTFGKYLDGENVFERLELGILEETENLTSTLLAMQVRGYSTTSRDIVNDLVPL